MTIAARVITGRRSVLLAAAACAIVAVFGGLARLGWHVPVGAAQVVGHGPVFVLGVFLTVISLERAVALGGRAAYIGPVAAASGGLALAVGVAPGPWLILVGALALVAMNIAIVRRQAAAFTWTMLVGSVVLALSVVAWLRGAPVFVVVPAWMTFFVLTIVAERLELSRLVQVSRLAGTMLVLACGTLAIATLSVMTMNVTASIRVMGVALVAIGAWQLRFDAARRTIRRPGLPRYAALAVLAGACWLVVTGGLLLVRGLPIAGPDYDAPLHALFVGFVMSAVLAHAPIIGPAVARIEVPFHPVLYVPLVVLHVSVAMRITGDWFSVVELRRAGALGNVIALGLLPLAVGFARRTFRATANVPRRRMQPLVTSRDA